MTQRLEGKKIIITGASTGIGREAVSQFINEGAKVAIIDINDSDGKDAAKELNNKKADSVLYLHGDVTDAKSVEEYTKKAVEWLGGLDGVVLHAGYQRSGEIDEFDMQEWDNIFNVNAKGVYLGAKYAIPYLKKNGSGSIVCTASLAGKRGGPGLTAYSSSKGAVVAFTFAAAMELAPHSIRVNCVCPGWIDTPFNNPAINYMGGRSELEKAVTGLVPLKRQGSPAELAPIYTYLLSDESSYMTAQSISVDGGVA